MIDKKVIVVIVVFIVGGLFVYSFANPIENDKDDLETVAPNVTTPIEEEKKDESNVEEDQTVEKPLTEQTENSTQKPTVNRPSTSNTNSNGNTGNHENTNPPAPAPAPEIKPTFALFSKGEGETANINFKVSGNQIKISGEMEEKEKDVTIDGKTLHSGNYVKIKISAPAVYSEEELNKAVIQTKDGTYGRDELSIDSTTGKAYFYIIQEFLNSDGVNITSVPININWGYGETIHYTLTLDITVNPKVTE